MTHTEALDFIAKKEKELQKRSDELSKKAAVVKARIKIVSNVQFCLIFCLTFFVDGFWNYSADGSSRPDPQTKGCLLKEKRSQRKRYGLKEISTVVCYLYSKWVFGWTSFGDRGDVLVEADVVVEMEEGKDKADAVVVVAERRKISKFMAMPPTTREKIPREESSHASLSLQ
jgi:hypothetical protein